MSTAGSTVDPALVEDLRAHIVRSGGLAPGTATAEVVAALAEDALDHGRHILSAEARREVIGAVVDATLGLGPLEPLLRDPSVTEVMVNGPGSVWVERDGRIQPAEARFADSDHLLHVIDRILAPLGRRLDESSPMVDARLPDGRRWAASPRHRGDWFLMAPVSIRAPLVGVRGGDRHRLRLVRPR